ncbi:PREDICTED: small cysteine-rich protein 3-like [Acropora digitifera]|uniref:small cysteine-rich protein 3-like n=1 Tax=Acropora digitifera TaxID=70779 RepID=UPI00077A5F78|nr:PREDICTED: small cysteine-rich protein 3-like [Acropora digitifera]
MGVKLNICLFLLLVATISSQGFNLRKKDDSKDEKPFGIDGRFVSCHTFKGRCTSNRAPCHSGYRQCPLPGCGLTGKCCCPEPPRPIGQE